MPNRVLVVDDEADLELLITQRFRSKIRSGELSFDFASNGAIALEKLRTDNTFELILTDINMPVMDGLTLLTKIKEEKLFPKAVVISAYGDLDNIRVAMNRGAFDFITKPIDMVDLETTINKAFTELEMIKQGIKAREDLLQTTREKEFAVVAKEKAEEAKRLEQMFLANMSHEIRTPLNAIVGMTNLALKTELDEKQKKYLNIIKASSDNLLVIINDILDISKIEAGKLNFENISFHVKDVIENVYESLKIKAEEKNLQLIVDLPENLPEYVIGDPVRISQVLINLIGNAIKFTEHGSVTIKTEVRDKLGNESKIINFRIIDTGIGIPKDKLDKIFESFSQASSETTRKYGGTGLGLTISKQIVELLGGKISVQSAQGKGSEFSFYITFKLGSKPEKTENKNLYPEGAINHLQHLKILLAEDNLFNQAVAIDTLESLLPGIKVDVAENGRQALDKIVQAKYDLVIMDIQMPEMDGYDTAKYIREKMEPPIKNIPILAMTANVIKEEIQKCYDSGMDEYIAKPFNPDDLLAKIAGLILK